MGLSLRKRAKATQEVKTGLKTSTGALDGSTTVEVLNLHGVAEKLSWQSDGDLAGNIEFSVNGRDFFTSTSFTANTPGSYNSHNITSVRVTRTGGSGQLHFAIK